MTERTKIVTLNVFIATLLCFLTAACGWFTYYLNASVNNVWMKGFGTLAFGSLTIIFLIGAIFTPSVIRDATAARRK